MSQPRVSAEERARAYFRAAGYLDETRPNDHAHFIRLVSLLVAVERDATCAEEQFWFGYLPELAVKVQNIIENYAMTFSAADISPAHPDGDLLTKIREREKQISEFVGEIIRQRPVEERAVLEGGEGKAKDELART